MNPEDIMNLPSMYDASTDKTGELSETLNVKKHAFVELASTFQKLAYILEGEHEDFIGTSLEKSFYFEDLVVEDVLTMLDPEKKYDRDIISNRLDEVVNSSLDIKLLGGYPEDIENSRIIQGLFSSILSQKEDRLNEMLLGMPEEEATKYSKLKDRLQEFQNKVALAGLFISHLSANESKGKRASPKEILGIIASDAYIEEREQSKLYNEELRDDAEDDDGGVFVPIG